MHRLTGRVIPSTPDSYRACRPLFVTGLLTATAFLGACGGGGGSSTPAATSTPPSMSIADAVIGEGNSGSRNLDFTVTLSSAADTDVTVDYATSDATATAGSDYVGAQATLTIPAGNTSGTITVVVNGDTSFEPNETLGVTLSNASGATLATASASGVILNDDAGAGNRLNDTGVDTWGNDATNDLTASQASFPGQDADSGRDANAATNSNIDGRLGFSFVKLDANGDALADQAADYATTPWDCVVDNVTGLMWEVKTPSGAGGLRDAAHTYTWYNSASATNGGNAGTANGGTCNDATNCDTEKYVAQVNAARLCGYSDWRLPTRREFRSIVDHSTTTIGNTIDTNYFPNTVNTFYWTATTQATNAAGAWTTVFLNGGDNAQYKSGAKQVRLVRGGV